MYDLATCSSFTGSGYGLVLRCTESLCTTRDRVYSVCHVESYDIQKRFSVKRMHVRHRI